MRYAGKKILTMCVTLFAVTLFVFLAFHMISGDPGNTGEGRGTAGGAWIE